MPLPESAKRLLSAAVGAGHQYLFPAIPRKRHVVFDCVSDYHYHHVAPLVRRLAAEGRVDVSVVTHGDSRKWVRVPGVRYRLEVRPPVVRHYDLWVSTDYGNDPWWLRDYGSKSAFIGHGVGPKVSYYEAPPLRAYDAMLCPGPTIYTAQSRLARDDARIYKTGLPATDDLAAAGYQPERTRQYFADDAPMLLYAPTWSKDPAMVPMDETILGCLADLRDVNVIIRPHPLLLEPAACGGKDWTQLFRAIAGPRVRIHAGPGTSVYDVLPLAAVLLTDMSSVLFEYLLVDRPILLYVGDRMFRQYAADEFIPMIRRATTSVTRPSCLSELVGAANDHPEHLRAARAELRAMFFYNIGSATAHCVRAIYDTLGIEPYDDTGGDLSSTLTLDASRVG